MQKITYIPNFERKDSIRTQQDPLTLLGTESSTTYIQNETVSGDVTITDDIIRIGLNVNDTKEADPVAFQGGKIELNAKEVIIESNTTVNKNTEFLIEPK